MVHLEKIPGQVGHMVIQEDGTVVASSGELASSESTSQHVIGLVSNVLSANFAAAATSRGSGGGGDVEGNEAREAINGFVGPGTTAIANGTDSSKPFKWSRVTVSFGDKSYVACLSNRRIQCVKRKPIPAI